MQEKLRRAPSSLHKDMQRFLQNRYSGIDLSLERRFPTIKRTADVVIESKKLIIEIQTSMIKTTEALKRIEDYGKLGYTIRWLLHETPFQKSSFINRLFIRQEALLFTFHTAELFTFKDFDGNEVSLEALVTPPSRLKRFLSIFFAD
ncbi:MAG: competence protein CoiA family protein [Chlamydiia bacterium]